MENRLLELVEYRSVLGALTTSIDGLLVASVAIQIEDAELIAASTVGDEERGDSDRSYSVTSSEYGVLHVARGQELRLVVLSEPGTDPDSMRDLMTGTLQSIEEAIRV